MPETNLVVVIFQICEAPPYLIRAPCATKKGNGDRVLSRSVSAIKPGRFGLTPFWRSMAVLKSQDSIYTDHCYPKVFAIY